MTYALLLLVAITVPLLGILAGLGRAKYRLAPVVATAVIVLAYAALLTGVGIWARSCWNCTVGEASGEWTRQLDFALAVFFPGVLVIATVVGIWLAAWVSTALWPPQPRLNGRNVTLTCVTLVASVAVLLIFFGG
jgi:hypothetical protein